MKYDQKRIAFETGYDIEVNNNIPKNSKKMARLLLVQIDCDS